MRSELQAIQADFDQAIDQIQTLVDLDALEVRFLGRKQGVVTELLKQLKTLPKDEVGPVGALANEVKTHIADGLAARRRTLDNNEIAIDVTLPGLARPVGHLHLMTTAIRQISDVFARIGFERVRYPEVEWDYYAFEALNMPADHVARDEWETFFIDRQPIDKKLGQRVLTPHTSSGQIRKMEEGILPIKMINISKCYRRQIDVSHVPMFHQFEGLCIDRGVNITHLKGTIDYFVQNFFGPERTTRLRPYHFQFTEPSFEIDINCGICLGKGCRMCKEGWLELGGAGMVHPNVLKAGGIDASVYSGFAFGWGVERTYLMKSGVNIDDLRALYKNDLGFLQQF